jgi:predicted metal-binding protein
MELQILKARVILHKTLLKLKASREEIEAKNEHRKDLINSMLETESELSEVLNTFIILEKQSRGYIQESYRLERLNLDLKCEIRQLENQLKVNNF